MTSFKLIKYIPRIKKKKSGLRKLTRKVKGSYERLEGRVNRSYPIFTSFQVKARQESKFSRCATK
jgi:hypothetical protein